MKKTKKLLLMAVCAAVLALPGGLVFAQYDIADAEAEMTDVARALSNVFGPNLGGMSFIGEPVGYSFIPHAEIGVAGGAVLVPLDDITAGTSLGLDLGELSRLPIPTIAAHGKFSLRRLELGAKVGGIPEIKDKEAGAGISNFVIGGKVRYRLLNFSTFGIRGGASVGGFLDYMNGRINVTQSESIPIDVTGDGTIDGEITNTAGFETSWNATTVGGEAQANLQLLVFNLFAGTRLSKSFGKAETVLSGTTQVTALNGEVAASVATPISIKEEAKPEGIDTFLFGGAEVKLLMLTLTGRFGYELSTKNYTVDGGLRLQF